MRLEGGKPPSCQDCYNTRDAALTGFLFFSTPPCHRTLHQQFESYKQEVRRIGAETRRQQTQQKDDAPTCGICRKTKFADGCGHLCSYCQTKFCARCGGRVSLRSNNVRKTSTHSLSAPHLIALADGQSGPAASVLSPSPLCPSPPLSGSHFGQAKVYWMDCSVLVI